MSKVAAQKQHDKVSRALKKIASSRLGDYINKDNSAAQKAYECSYSWSPSSGRINDKDFIKHNEDNKNDE